MTHPLTQSERELFEALIIASTTLCTVAHNASQVLSEEFESMVTGPLTAVQEILNKCPTVSERWDGTFRQEDCDIENYTPEHLPDHLRQGRVGSAVKVTHRQTKLSVSVEQSADPERNRASAMRVLQQRVQDHWAAQTRISRPDPLR
jgi:hypothetical protein